MKVNHEGKEYEVKQDRTCDECGKSFYIMSFDLSLEKGNDTTGFSTCLHCGCEHVVYLHEVDI